ncbi:hypothetical protein [Nocardia sp. NPDC051981]|uniref:hypothetical protein n=1 Tax=Nocardia sp. NPDC051981 TaxID=3155417 RepID=UPI00342DE3DC
MRFRTGTAAAAVSVDASGVIPPRWASTAARTVPATAASAARAVSSGRDPSPRAARSFTSGATKAVTRAGSSTAVRSAPGMPVCILVVPLIR